MNYIKIISLCHPEVSVTCHGDPTDYSDIIFNGDTISKETLDGEELKYNKKIRRDEIDARTDELINAGFTYDGKLFSGSIYAQCDIESIYIDRDIMTYPITYATKESDGYIVMMGTDDLYDFYQAGKNAKMAIKVVGATLKLQIEGATTQSELDAIVDNRT